MSVQIHTAKQGNGTVVQFHGRVDATSAPSVEQALVAVIDQGEKRLIIDCSALDFISSAGCEEDERCGWDDWVGGSPTERKGSF